MSSVTSVDRAGVQPPRPATPPVERGESVVDGIDDSGFTARTVVVGGGQMGRLLARRLLEDRPVHYVDDDRHAVDRAARRHEATYVPDLTDQRWLSAFADEASDVVVATPRDATNLLVAQHCRTVLAAPRIVVVVADPRNHGVYPPDLERVCATTVLVDTVAEALDDDPLAAPQERT